MNDLFNKFKESRSTSGSKRKYGIVECIAIMLLVNKGKDVKEIEKVVNRSTNSLTYVKGRVLNDINSYEELCEKLKVEYVEENEVKHFEEAQKLIG